MILDQGTEYALIEDKSCQPVVDRLERVLLKE